MKWLLIFIFCGVVKIKHSCDVEGYFWRDFYGDIPAEAIPGGKDVKGNPIYIGQAFFSDYMVPGKIYKDDFNVYVIYNGKVVPVKENVKILCSLHPSSLKWLWSRNTKIEDINEELVRGGFEKDDHFYIGRQTWKGETSVGHIPFRKKPNERVLFFAIGKGVWSHGEFEILVYNNQQTN